MRIFDDFKTDDDTATRWRVDSCDCIIIYKKGGTVLHVQQACKLHKGTPKKDALAVIKQHRIDKGLIDTDITDAETQSNKRAAEKKRISKI